MGHNTRMKYTVQTRLIIGFAIAVILVLVMGMVSHQTTSTLVENAEWVDHTHE